MKIGVPKEVKNREGRVAMTPSGVVEFRKRGHEILIQTSAGIGSGFSDQDYIAVGATIIADAASVWSQSDMILKVKEPIASEYQYLRDDLTLFTYLHLAAEPKLTKALCDARTEAYGYETVRGADRRLPLLEPMSEIAGRMAPIMGAFHLAGHQQGSGQLISGVPGVAAANVVIIGGGTAGENAAKIAVGMNANVTVLDVQHSTLRRIDVTFGGRVKTLYSTEQALVELLPTTDLLIGAVLIPGDAAPKLIRREHLKHMKPGSVILDIAVDQGGCCETTKATTHDEPTYVVDGIVHYCVANMPGAYPRTSTLALTQAVLPYALKLADCAAQKRSPENAVEGFGLQVADGQIVCPIVKKSMARA